MTQIYRCLAVKPIFRSVEMEVLDAEFYAAEALAADLDTWLVFDGESNEESFEEWLEKYRPSQVSRYDGIGWISIQLPTQPDSLETKADVIGLQQSWESLQKSGRPITHQTITQLAKSHNVLCGKWFLHVASGGKVDHIWRLVACGVMEGKLGQSAKVSPFEDSPNQKHLICIYNDDFSNEEEVFQLENSIRHLCGIRCSLKYKPDVYTYLGVYRRNKWGLRPSLYESVYDICKGVSVVKPTGVDKSTTSEEAAMGMEF